MFGHKRHHGCGGWQTAGRFGGEGRKGGGGPFGRHRGGPLGGGPFGGGPFGGGGRRRMFDSGALRLVVLGLIAEEPRHGYDIIKALEAKFQGAYSPSPGAIYPMLQMLEEADLVVSRTEGNKRLYSITEQGTAFLAQNQAELDRINEQLAEASQSSAGAALGDAARDLVRTIYGRLREGSLSPEQARKALDVLRKAREELDGI
ncbi:MAG: PadR family transcriptional regulator [Mesorhizobium sp.]